MNFSYSIEKEGPGLARAGVIHTPHGDIATPAFIPVGTKATVKGLTPEMVRGLGADAILANTYHLYLEPGHELLRASGGVARFMHWDGPTFTDSGGFQVFSLGEAFGKGVAKVSRPSPDPGFSEEGKQIERSVDEGSDGRAAKNVHARKAVIDDDGVTFTSHIDGSRHRFTPERSMEIQHDLGADMIFAFDECTSPLASDAYQKEALDRTHRWAERSLLEHKRLGVSIATGEKQALFGVVQGGRSRELREESARTLSRMDFDGFGIGGSFTKDDIGTAVSWVNALLPKEKPRHLLGIGEPEDIILGIAAGIDTFDCVSPTRQGRNGALYTKGGRINIKNAQYVHAMGPIEEGCGCYTCQNFTRAYVAHLFRADEMLAGTLGSIHNLHFLVVLAKKARQALLDGTFDEYVHKYSLVLD